MNIKKILAFRDQIVRSGFSDFHCNNVTAFATLTDLHSRQARESRCTDA